MLRIVLFFVMGIIVAYCSFATGEHAGRQKERWEILKKFNDFSSSYVPPTMPRHFVELPGIQAAAIFLGSILVP